MKAFRILFFLAVAAVPGWAAEAPVAGKAPVPATGSPRFKQVRERIDTLFQHRNEKPPPPGPRSNPFRPPGAPVDVRPTPGGPDLSGIPDAPSSDLRRLTQAAAALTISGTYEILGQMYVMINGKQYKENDEIPVQIQGETVFLRVRQISKLPRGVTVVLNETEMTIKFK